MLIAYLALNWLTNSLVAKSLFVEDFFGRCYVRGIMAEGEFVDHGAPLRVIHPFFVTPSGP